MPPTDTVLVIDREGSAALPDDVVRTLRAVGLELHHAHEDSAVETLRGWVANGKPPPAVLLMPDLGAPLAVARLVHRAAPLVQIVFLVEAGSAERLREAMSVAPMIGNHWTIVEPDADRLAPTLRAAVRSTRQRSNLRTTLDRMNLRLREAPAPAGDDLRRLVISDRHLASVLEYAADAIVSIDGDGVVATWNRGAEHLFGLNAAAAVGRTVDRFAAEGYEAELLTWIRKAWTGSPVIGRELPCRASDGTPFLAELTLAPVREEDDAVIAVSLIARDATERKRYEREIRALNEQLAQRVREMREANAALQDALERLEASRLELIELNRELEVQATTDALTGVKNRIVFQNSLHEMVAFADRQGTPLSILIVDIDHFKRINDTLGHQEGDRVLRRVADTLRESTREQDVVARYGGEEFVVLLPNTTERAARAVAESLRAACRRAADVGPDLSLTISVGGAERRPGESDVELVRRADRALYRAKDLGRDRVAFAEAATEDAR